jgi:hypothetical protein
MVGCFAMVFETDPEIQRLLDDFRELATALPLEGFASNQSDTLYHYTDANGLLGILQRKCIRAGNVRYMNDSSELNHVGDVISEAATKLEGEATTEASRTFLRILRESPLRYHFPDTEVYAACFSESWDVLSQWRSYANDGAGYAVGIGCDSRFQVIRVKQDATAQGGQGTENDGSPERPEVWARLYKVIYLESEQLARVTPWLIGLVQALDRRALNTPSLTDQGIAQAFITVKLEVVPLGVTMKNGGFEEEREWRLVVSDDPSGWRLQDRTQFKSSRFGLSPFIELRHADSLPLVSIAHGPKLSRDEAPAATVLMLRGHGYMSRIVGHDVPDVPNQVSLRHSKTSYR